MSNDLFKEALLQRMEQKTHWAWPLFTSGEVKKERLHLHFEQEYEVYVRDFPILIGWAFVQCPVAEVRRELAENLFEEETGGLVAGKPHPELFLRYPRGLGFDMSRFDSIELLPASQTYRAFLDDACQNQGWEVAAAIATLFIEGTPHERGEVQEGAPKRPTPPLSEHPLVKHYGLPLADLELTKAHREVEGEHRQAAWRILLSHISPDKEAAVLAAMDEALRLWKTYRDSVSLEVGLSRS